MQNIFYRLLANFQASYFQYIPQYMTECISIGYFSFEDVYSFDNYAAFWFPLGKRSQMDIAQYNGAGFTRQRNRMKLATNV